MAYVYIKDEEGFVVKKKKTEVLPNETIITEEEYAELSGDNYYKSNFGHGGKRAGAGRKPKTGVVLKFQIRVLVQLAYSNAHSSLLPCFVRHLHQTHSRSRQ